MSLNHRSLFVQISVVKIEHNVNDRRIPSLNELQSIMESSTERESIGSECSTQHVSLDEKAILLTMTAFNTDHKAGISITYQTEIIPAM